MKSLLIGSLFIALGTTACASTSSAPMPAVVPTTALHGPALDASAVPPGSGWVCFSTAPSLRCYRDVAACEAGIVEANAAAGDEDDTIVSSPCLELTTVWAMTARDISRGTTVLLFWTNGETCEIDGSYYRNDNEYYDHGSGCAQLP